MPNPTLPPKVVVEQAFRGVLFDQLLQGATPAEAEKAAVKAAGGGLSAADLYEQVPVLLSHVARASDGVATPELRAAAEKQVAHAARFFGTTPDGLTQRMDTLVRDVATQAPDQLRVKSWLGDPNLGLREQIELMSMLEGAALPSLEPSRLTGAQFVSEAIRSDGLEVPSAANRKRAEEAVSAVLRDSDSDLSEVRSRAYHRVQSEVGFLPNTARYSSELDETLKRNASLAAQRSGQPQYADQQTTLQEIVQDSFQHRGRFAFQALKEMVNAILDPEAYRARHFETLVSQEWR